MSEQNLTLDEVEKDLQFSSRDIDALCQIINGIGSFIRCGQECGEDRARFRIDLMRFQSLLDDALRIHAKIEATEFKIKSAQFKTAIGPFT